jgi:hypothetical protein
MPAERTGSVAGPRLLPAQRAEWHAAWGAFRVAAIYAVLAAMWLLAYGRGPVILAGASRGVNRLHSFKVVCTWC